MTLRSTYQELMGQVEVTPEMRARILAHVQTAEREPVPENRPLLRRWLPLAACIALVLVMGGKFLRAPEEPVQPDTPVTQVVSPFTSAASIEELEELTGIRLPETVPLPFAVEEVSYQAIGTQVAQIAYQGEGQTAVLRKSLGTEDNSGDYTHYAKTQSVQIGDITGELKGDGALYPLACWHTDSESLSLRLSQGIEEAAWLDLISALSDQP